MVDDILLVNSDLTANRGDRAIAEGILALVRRRFPEARVTIMSQRAERDRAWFDADVLDMDVQSVSPTDFVALLRAARRADLVLWGGGEILKDYTNKAALWYWTAKMTAVARANPELYGVYQGIGPTMARSSQRLIAGIVDRCRRFIVRDVESVHKAVAWGADGDRMVASFDPAVLPTAEPVDDHLRARLADEFDLDDAFLDDFVCIGPRDWFHYQPGGILPYEYVERFRRRPRVDLDQARRNRTYRAHLEQLVSRLSERPGSHVLLAPMHMTQGDTELCRELAAAAANPDVVRVLDHDTLSPAAFRSVVGAARAMIGFRLHSNIVGISAGVPCLNVYYVDKGRVFFDQVGQAHRARPIEDALDEGFVDEVLAQLDDLLDQREAVHEEIVAATATMRSGVTDAFDDVFGPPGGTT